MARIFGAVVVSAVLLLASSQQAMAYPSYQSNIPNGRSVERGGTAWAAVGHSSASGGSKNQFGLDFVAAGRTWTKDLCEKDSDGDGYSNGLELGDPACTWTKGGTPSRTSSISHPGYADSTPVFNPTPNPASPVSSSTTSEAPVGSSGSTTSASTSEAPVGSSGSTTSASTTEASDVADASSAASGFNVTMPNDATEQLVSSTFTSNEGITYSWKVLGNGTASADVIEMTLALEREQYAAFGVSPSAMNGPLVACYVAEDANGMAQPMCSDWEGSGLSIRPAAAQRTSIVSARRTGGSTRRQGGATTGFEVTIRYLARDLNVDSSEKRVIFATGSYNTASNAPTQHSSSQRSSARVSFYTGDVDDSESVKYIMMALIIIFVVIIFVIVFAAITNFAKIVFRPTTSKILRVSLVFVYIGFLLLVFFMKLKDHNENGKAMAVQRAAGDVAAFAFWFVLWPVPKHVGLTQVTGASWERLLNYHIVVGTSTFILTTLHFIGMAAKLKGKGLFETTGKHPTLWGFLAWICTVILVLSSLILRRKKYNVFRALHWLFIPLLVFAFMHYFEMIFVLIPPLLNLLVDWIVRVYRNVSADATLVSATPIPGAKTTMVRVRVNPGAKLPSHGQYMMVVLEGAFGMHPYTVAWVDAQPGASSATASPDCDDTNAAGNAANTKGDPELVFFMKSMGEGTWSQKVNELATAGELKPGSKVVLTGPYGSLQVPLAHAQHLVLVGGGIGITPMLGLLQQIANTPELIPSSVTVVWSLRDIPLAHAMQGFFDTAVQSLQARGIPVAIDLYSSAKDVDVASIQGPYQFHAGRPNLPNVLSGLQSKGSCESSAVEGAAVYACGPQSLMDDAETAAKNRPDTWYHSELFEF